MIKDYRIDNEGTENIVRMFRSVSLSMIAAEIAGIAAVLIDGIITSRFLGVDAYTAISMIRPFASIVLVISGFLSSGCNVVCSRMIGSGNKEESNETFNLAVLLALAAGALLLILGLLFPEILFRICGISLQKYPELNPYLFSYMKGYLIGIPAHIAVQVMGPVLVMDRGKKLFAESVAVLFIVNVAGDLLNVFVFHGGAFGMGLSTSVAFIAQFAVAAQHFTKKDRYFSLSLSPVKWGNLSLIVRNGTTNLVKRFSSAFKDSSVNYINIVTALTSAAIAARGIQNDLYIFLICIPIALGKTLLIMIGTFYRSNDLQGLKRLYSYSIRLGLVLSGGAAAVTFAAAPFLAGLYTSDPEVLSLAVFGIRSIAIALVMDTLIILIQQYLQGIEKTRRSGFLAICEQTLLPVPTAIVLGQLYGSKGILASVAVSRLLFLALLFAADVIRFRGIPKGWDYVMFLPEDFGGAQSDNYYAQIRGREDVIPVSRKAEAFCLQHGADNKKASQVALFLEELAFNVFDHAEKTGTGERRASIDYRLYMDGGRICFSMMDLGEYFDPTLFYELHSDDPGHIGIRLVNKMAEEVRYYSTFGSNNLTVYL